MKQGAAESLPYPDQSFDLTLMVTAICFLDDMDKAMEELRRILKPGGLALFGFVDSDSPLGHVYQQHKDEDVFYRAATFRSATEVIECLENRGFVIEFVRQTVFGRLDEITEVQETREGHGEGGFVVLRARKPG
jgi:ubiquinone/menaquinone biosynthesis C-methylase UbiE